MDDVSSGGAARVDAALERWAPSAAEALRTLTAAAAASGDPSATTLLAQVCAAQHGLTPLLTDSEASSGPTAPPASTTDWRSLDLDTPQRVSLATAERFAIDVTTIGDEERAGLGAALGAGTGDLVFLLYVLDMVPRVRSALAQLLDDGDAPADGSPSVVPSPVAEAAVDPDAPALWPSIDEFIRVVARLDALDPVTAELVRLRGARQHQCRMCQSLRNRTAMLAGADDEMFAAVDHPGDGGLSSRHEAALALVDAMIWTPAHLDDDVIGAVRREFSPEEQVELVLDVMRNAANKIAVALAADGANVDEGYEIYDIGPDGDPVYGLTLA